jgi:hypothetical protein
VARQPLAKTAATAAGRNLPRCPHAHLPRQAGRVSRPVRTAPPAVRVQRAVATADTLVRHST